MRIILAGHKGQLGRTLMQVLGTQHITVGVDLPEHDITDRSAVMDLVREIHPDIIINSAAMTNVDGCTKNPQLAYTVNGIGTQNLALAAATIEGSLIVSIKN